MLIKEFCALYSISGETFRQYRKKAETAKGSPVVEKQGSKTYVITDVEAILAIMPEETKARRSQNEQKTEPVEPVETVNAELVDPFSRLTSGKLATYNAPSVPTETPTSALAPSESLGDVSGRLDVQRRSTEELRGSLAQLLDMARGVNQAYRQSLEVENQQLAEQEQALRDAIAELEAEQELTRQQEIRQKVASKRVENTKQQLAGKVINLQDFFAQKAGS